METPVDARAVTAGLIPLAAVVAVDPAGWYPFGPANFTAVAVAVLAAAAVCMWTGRTPAAGRLPHALVIAWACLLGWLALAAAFGLDRWYAWIGTPERRLGLATWLLFAVAGWVGTQLVATGRPPLRSLGRAVAIATVWCSGYSLIEWWWRSPIETSSTTDRLGGPFGSASYLGAALCLLIPVSAGVALDRDERRGWRSTAAVAAAAGAVCIVGTGTRAAWVGLAAGGLALVIARRPSRRCLAIGAAVVGVAVLVVSPRLGDVTERSTSWDSRVDEWQVAVRAIEERPLLGAGPEGYRIVVADGVDDVYERTYGREVLPDRAHSAPLDLAAIGGLPAGAAYLGLMALAAIAAWRGRRGGPVVAGFSVAVVAYGVQQLLLFPIAELDPTWWLFIGALAAYGTDPRADDPPDTPRPRARSRQRGLAVSVAALACAVFAAGVVEVAADRAARTALARDSPAHARRAAALRPDVVRYHLLEASFGAGAQSLAGVDDEITAVRRAADVSPNDPIVRRSLANALGHRAAVTGDAADVAAALDAWTDLVADDPHCGTCWYELGATELLAGNRDKAVAAWRRAADLGGGSAAAADGGLASLGFGGSG